MLRSTTARKILRRTALAAGVYLVVMAIALLVVKLGDCQGAIGWSEIRCTRIPTGLGSAAMSVFFIGGAVLVLGWWMVLLAIAAPVLILEIRARRKGN